MKPAFDNISEKKKKRIIDACMAEFGEHGYAASSMDGVIRKAGISKGGLYEYVSSKLELFLFTINHAYSELYKYLKERLRFEKEGLQDDLLLRLRHVAELAIDFYLEHPDYIFLLVRTSNLPDEKIAVQVDKIFGHYFFDLFGNAERDRLRYPGEKVLELAMWLLAKTRLDFISEIRKETDPVKIRSDYMENWEFYLGVMEAGIYSKTE